MHRRKTRKIQRGGKFLSAGSFACVFNDPPLKCKGEANRRTSKISKLMYTEFAKNEIEISKKLKIIDPEQIYFIYSNPDRDICIPNIPDSTNGMSNCRNSNASINSMDISRGQTTLLFQEYGGKNLDIIIKDIKSNKALYIPFLQSIVNIIDGLQKIHSNGIFHNDIKTNNILSMNTDSGLFSTRFIDIGGMVDIDIFEDPEDINVQEFVDRYKYPIYYRPFEQILVYTGITNEDISEDIEKDMYYKRFKSARNEIKGYKIPMPYLSEQIDYYSDRIASSIKYLNSISDAKERYKQILVGCDIYMLGLTMAELYSLLIGHYDVDVSDIPIKIEYENSMNAEWNDHIKQKISIPFFTLIHRMLNADIRGRPTLSEIREQYVKILADMEAELPKGMSGGRKSTKRRKYLSRRRR